MSQPEWEVLVEEVRDLRTRVARMEVAMGMTENGQVGDPCIDACHATAARAVNAVQLICNAPSGIHSQFTLPLIIGRGLLRR